MSNVHGVHHLVTILWCVICQQCGVVSVDAAVALLFIYQLLSLLGVAAASCSAAGGVASACGVCQDC